MLRQIPSAVPQISLRLDWRRDRSLSLSILIIPVPEISASFLGGPRRDLAGYSDRRLGSPYCSRVLLTADVAEGAWEPVLCLKSLVLFTKSVSCCLVYSL